MNDWIIFAAIFAVLGLLALAWVVRSLDESRWRRQQRPTRRQIKRWRKSRTITIVPNRRRAS